MLFLAYLEQHQPPGRPTQQEHFGEVVSQTPPKGCFGPAELGKAYKLALRTSVEYLMNVRRSVSPTAYPLQPSLMSEQHFQ
ncbi:hypothetical protein D3C75_1303970 [compost metagenome]